MLPLWIFFLFINIPFFLPLLLVCCRFLISCSSLFYFYSLLCYSCPIFFLLFYCPVPLLIAVTMFHILVFIFIFVTLTFFCLACLFWCLASVCPIVTAKTWYLRIFVTQSAIWHHYNWIPRRMKVVIIIICCLLKMLKFCTAAFGSKYETYADTFEVGSCCSWCTTDRHRE
jgi:hypothetical protein